MPAVVKLENGTKTEASRVLRNHAIEYRGAAAGAGGVDGEVHRRANADL